MRSAGLSRNTSQKKIVLTSLRSGDYKDQEGAADRCKVQCSEPGVLFALLERDHLCNSRYECKHRKKIAKTQDQATETSIVRNAVLPDYVGSL